ncbi:MAG: Rrf2 family transcriptional regulator [Planctomycetota bacterium]|nr:Rrf2 family transcriptional regulator [Planctomycetota bacterium]
MIHGKATETAIAAMGVLAERYDEGRGRCSAEAIASARGLQRPFVAKILTELARAGLVRGVRGPGGGYTLARSPDTIYIQEVSALFEPQSADACPFGGGICGVGRNCPLHDMFTEVRRATDRIMKETTFAVFCA